MIELTRKITRLLPQGIVAEIGPEGVSLRRYRGKKQHTVSWEQVASLEPEHAICRAAEQAAGERCIRAMGAC